VLAALTVGYFLGGVLADRRPSATVLGTAVSIGSAFILALPNFATPFLRGGRCRRSCGRARSP
jgi:MFS family permease